MRSKVAKVIYHALPFLTENVYRAPESEFYLLKIKKIQILKPDLKEDDGAFGDFHS